MTFDRRETEEEGSNRPALIEVFKMYKGFTKMDTSELLTKDSNVEGTRRLHISLDKPRCIMDSMGSSSHTGWR